MADNARAGGASQRLTRRVIETYGAVCWLQLPGCTKRATTKDHIVPVDHGGTDAIENLRPACHPCNSKRRNLAISGTGGISVVVLVGPPSSAQEAHTAAHARPGDVVIDRDLIARAIAAPGSQQAAHIDRVVARAYAAAKDAALRMRAHCTVWIVHPVPTLRQVQQYARLRYRIVTIDAGRAVAEHQAAQREDRDALREISTWYARYPDGQASIERTASHRPITAITRHTAADQNLQPSRAW